MKKDDLERKIYKDRIIASILNTNNDIKMARKNYEFAEDEMIDYYLYEIKANQSKLDYLIKKSKECGIELDTINNIELTNIMKDIVV